MNKLLLTLAVCWLTAAPAQALVILQYHHISDSTPAITSTPPALFERHLEIIAEAGFEVLDLETVSRMVRSGRPLPDRSVLITFDDSYDSIYDAAFPRLKARSWPFVVFANTEPVDAGRPGFLTWAQLGEMAAAGGAIANHTVNHPHLVRRPDGTSAEAWRETVRREIVDAEARIHAVTGQRHRVLAFPYGEYDAELLDSLEALGYLGMSQSSGAVAPGDRLVLPRFPFGGRYGQPADFRLKLLALPLPVEDLELLDEAGRLLAGGTLPATVTRPVLGLKLKDRALEAALQCYASGQTAAVEKTARGDWLHFRTATPVPAGRSRYNCTARDPESGRYHWRSVPLLRPRADGSWPPEP